MQELLTGKKRLPGFQVQLGYKKTDRGVIPEDWEIRPVAVFGDVVTGGTPPTAESRYWGGEYPWVTPTDISTHRDIFVSDRWISSDGLKILRPLPADSVLVTCIASIGKNAILRSDGACNQQINAIVPNRRTSAEFLYYMFEIGKSYMLANAGITATNIISKSTFEGLLFPVPSGRSEQEAIATILSDMDAEIMALEAKLTKARAIKQGMMQELLTGRIRLI
jgi:type I restriction enzyme S subunit